MGMEKAGIIGNFMGFHQPIVSINGMICQPEQFDHFGIVTPIQVMPRPQVVINFVHMKLSTRSAKRKNLNDLGRETEWRNQSSDNNNDQTNSR